MSHVFYVSSKFGLHRFLHFIISYFVFLPISTLILFFYSSTVNSAQVTLAWDSNNEKDLAGYKVYYGFQSKNYEFSIDVGNTTRYIIPKVDEGKTYFIATIAYDTEGYESDFSNELVYSVSLPCTYLISPITQSYNASGGLGTLNVTTQANCSWTATSNAPWLIITSNSSGIGNGILNYTVLENIDISLRTGTLTVAGQALSVTQGGGELYALALTKIGTGSGIVATNPTGTNFYTGTVVTVTATPNADSFFDGWSGDCSGTSPTCTVSMIRNISISARFTRKTHTIKSLSGANGSISPSGAVLVNYGANQTFSIIPNTGPQYWLYYRRYQN